MVTRSNTHKNRVIHLYLINVYLFDEFEFFLYILPKSNTIVGDLIEN